MTATMERPTTTVHTRRKRRRLADGPLSTRIILTAVLGLISIYFLVPVYWLIVSATKNSTDLFGSFGLWFAHPQLLSNLGDLFSFDSHIYLRWGLNSIVYAGGGALVATALAAGAGYGLARFSFRGREAVFNTILAGVMLPQTALALPLYLLFTQADLANSYWAVLLPSFVSPFGVYLCRIYADAAVPPGLLEAARIDGASEFAIFRRIVLRIMSPALVTVFLFQFVGIWNNYFLPLVMLSDTKLYPITLGLTSWQGFASRQPLLYQLEVGGALVSVIPLMILIVVLQRFWRSGLTEGSVKA
ncbi:sugar ABC transporter permease [Actinocatenispora thailandica]|uniref:Sugar ABC transporter permease n=1 Tax=Actinocatenispora thailandica TaxID=227318 RepID=A0A7R7I0C4_9ACTN|nr:carbohydrate ABC transporter permease [Actinocatenispora thailandica]BCJ38436.1 sugar ABC transporter permease [Actinocatenispora thailandica]